MRRNEKILYRDGRPDINRPTGEQPVMDILGIAHEDFIQGKVTAVSKIIREMKKSYPEYEMKYLNALVNNTISSQWFNRQGANAVHIVERGVELYLTMKQNYLAQKWTKAANRKTNWVIAITIVSMLLTAVGVYATLKSLNQANPNATTKISTPLSP